MTFELDDTVSFCGCGTLTGNEHGLCQRCVDDEADWLNETYLRAVDPVKQ